MQNEEIGIEKNQLETIKSENLSSSNGLQSQLGDIKRYFQVGSYFLSSSNGLESLLRDIN